MLLIYGLAVRVHQANGCLAAIQKRRARSECAILTDGENPPAVTSAPASPDAYLDDDEDQSSRRPARAARGKNAPPDAKTTRFVAELADALDTEADANGGTGFTTTYRPSRHEAGWLLSSLRPFYDQRLIRDVLAIVKGGKEASVYCCAAGAAGPPDQPFLAAKVYRPQKFRNLRNDKMYREGRSLLTAEGRVAKESDQRTMRAVAKKSAFGLGVAHTSWLMHEYVTLEKLHAAGANVPQPFAAGENAILMTFAGDENRAAPTLIEITLDPDEAQVMLAEVLQTIELMLGENVIHGDLSAYNILYHDGRAFLIDFPQVTDPRANPHARMILARDVARVCDYFTRQGARTPDSAKLAARLWKRYGVPDEEPEFPLI